MRRFCTRSNIGPLAKVEKRKIFGFRGHIDVKCQFIKQLQLRGIPIVVYAQPLLAVVVIVILWKYTFGLLDFTPLQDFFEKLVPHERLKGRIALALVLALKSGIVCFLYCIYCWFFVMPKQLKESLVGIFRRKLLRKG